MFIVIEGIDGAGHTTQCNLLKQFFKNSGIDFLFLKTPNKTLPIGRAYYSYLQKEYELNTEAVFLLCASDVIMNKEKIINGLKEGKLILFERYITSTLAYQTANGFDFEKGVKIIKLLNFPKADLIIYLDIPVDVSIERKLKEKAALDRHESDRYFLERVKKVYEKEIEMNFLGKWVRVDATKDVEAVHSEILKVIKNKLKTK
jgi:dTMP kinase